MSITFIDAATTIAYAAIAIDFILQIRRVWSRKSSADISAAGTIIRTIAALIISTKLFYMGDLFVSIGQGGITALLLVYLVLVIRFRTL